MKYLTLLLLCVFSLYGTHPAQSVMIGEATPTPSPPVTASCSHAVDSMSSLHDLDFPEALYDSEQEIARKDFDFDANTYFEHLTHLRMMDGYTLDYVYSYDFMGGSPTLYARAVDAARLADYTDFQKAFDSRKAYLEYILVDDTPQGFLEYVALLVMGDQFYLWWHANYNDHRIVCDDDALEELIRQHSETAFGIPFDDEVIDRVRALDIEPQVEILDDVARVDVITFTKWGGFSRVIFEISRSAPHVIVSSNSIVLVPYDCGILF